MTTKIHTLTDAQGRPLRFILTGQAHDSTTAADLLAGRTTTGVIADKAYDNNALRELIQDAGAAAVIPSLGSRKIIIPHDRLAYPAAQPHRALLQQAQTLQTHRHTL